MFDKLANDDFERALIKSFWRRIRTMITGDSNELIAYDEVKDRFPSYGQHDLGLAQVPVDQIIGSVGRYRDFDRAFLPTQKHTRDRWISIDRAHYQDVILPPVELYKIGEIYFVKDGNHRISVAHERGQVFVDAYVIEIDVPGPVYSEKDLDKLALLAEHKNFIDQTHLDTLRPEANFETELAGQYQMLLEQISAHRWYMGERRGAEVPYDEAVLSWYDNVYQPVVEIINEQNLIKSFPNNTDLDLYIWIVSYQKYLRQFSTDRMNDAQKEVYDRLVGEQPEQPIRKLISILMHTDLLDELSARLDYARFMDQTHLFELRPEARMEATIPGAYDQLLVHISAHQFFLGEQQHEEVPYQVALLSWYDSVYQPLVDFIREQKILDAFPDRTEADLYLWIIARQWYLREAEGTEVPLEEAMDVFAEEQNPKVRKALKKAKETSNEDAKLENPDSPETLGNSPDPGDQTA
jgi:hypothetical protein